ETTRSPSCKATLTAGVAVSKPTTSTPTSLVAARRGRANPAAQRDASQRRRAYDRAGAGGLCGADGKGRPLRAAAVLPAERAGLSAVPHSSRGHLGAHEHHRAGIPTSARTTAMSHRRAPDHGKVTSPWFGSAVYRCRCEGRVGWDLGRVDRRVAGDARGLQAPCRRQNLAGPLGPRTPG